MMGCGEDGEWAVAAPRQSFGVSSDALPAPALVALAMAILAGGFVYPVLLERRHVATPAAVTRPAKSRFDPAEAVAEAKAELALTSPETEPAVVLIWPEPRPRSLDDARCVGSDEEGNNKAE